MNDEHNELNDIILKRNDKSSTRKKMLIGVGTLVIIAIVIIFVMGRMSESTPGQLPQPEQLTQQPQPMPPVTATDDVNADAATADPDAQQHLDEVVARVKSEAEKEPVPLEQSEIVVIEEPSDTAAKPEETAPAAAPKSRVSAEPAPAASAPIRKPAPAPVAKATQPAYGDVYIQVG
ncbi:MAG: hypothetical protein P8Y65_06935, partial [Campylobacterales bacterium]